MTWNVEYLTKKPKLNKPILVEGLPGIGNVGKIAVDFLVDELKAKKLLSLFSYSLPHSVFVNDKNLVELPIIEMYYKELPNAKNDLLFLVGDIQPIDEQSCYEFCDKIIDIMEEFGGTDIITIGGIGLAEVPKKPRVFCTGNVQSIVLKYKKGTELDEKLYGIVGPIVGVTGVLLGIAGKRKREAIALLAETYGHPMYLGVKGAREVLKVLQIKLDLKINLDKLDREIKSLENEMKKAENLSRVSKETAIRKMESKLSDESRSYIG
jgi:uncharacterized protein